ncbi:uncharacterized protein [Nicotiana sylvestris]|uniref:uncharacterized protein n=1 Tax=Nicotiana sylvestris TaxID=4096 RepID=UPI00388CE351
MGMTPVVSIQGANMAERWSSEVAIAVLGGPSTSRQNHAPSSANEKGKGIMVDDYEFESDIDPEDMRMFEEGFTRTMIYMLEVESARKAEMRIEIFLKMAEKCSELEELLHAKDKELEVSKGVSAECEDLQAKVLSLRAELEQNATKVDVVSAEWTEKVVELEKKVDEMERAENDRVSALVRSAALEDTIRVLKSELESERAMTTLREARLEEQTGELDRDASILGDRVAALEAEKA